MCVCVCVCVCVFVSECERVRIRRHRIEHEYTRVMSSLWWLLIQSGMAQGRVSPPTPVSRGLQAGQGAADPGPGPLTGFSGTLAN